MKAMDEGMQLTISLIYLVSSEPLALRHLPGGSTRSDYISGVGVGNVGVQVYAALQSPGGNGAIVLTYNSSSLSDV